MAGLWQTPAPQGSGVPGVSSPEAGGVAGGVPAGGGAGRQTPPARRGGVQAVAVPAHCPLPSQTSLKVQALPSSHGVSAGWKASGGQYTLVPVQVSAASHASVAVWQTVPALAGG